MDFWDEINVFVFEKFFSFCNVKDPHSPDLESVSTYVPHIVMEPSHKLLTLFSSNLKSKDAALFTALGMDCDQLSSCCPLICEDNTGVLLSDELWTPQLSYGYPSLGRVRGD